MIILSIVIPNKNSGNLLKMSLESIRKSKLNFEFEVVIIDSNSFDCPFRIVEEFSDLNINFISEFDSGVYYAMNKSLNFCKGNWVFFLGAGDELYSNIISIDLFDSNLDYFYGKVFDFSNNKIVGCEVNIYDIYRFGFCHQSIFYKKAIFEYFSFNTKYYIKADLVLNMFLFSNRKLKGRFHDVVFCSYLGGGLSSKEIDYSFNRSKYNIIVLNLFNNFSFINLYYILKFFIFKSLSRF